MKLSNYITIVICLTSACLAMPPHPDWVNSADPDQIAEVTAILDDARQQGVNSPGEILNLQENFPQRDDEITLQVAVILVDFEDNEADRENSTEEHYLEMLFSEGEYETGSMRDYYLENSNDQVTIIGEIAGWYRMPRTYAYYCNNRYGLGGYPRNAQKLAEDALHAADDDLDYSQFDNDNNGTVEAVFITFAGSGAEEDPDNHALIWSHAWTVRNMDRLDNVRFSRYTAVPEDGKIGVYGHELGHALFGLPDLYNTGMESAGLGFWSMMAYGAWGDDGRRPLHFDPWCKLQLGWIDVLELEHDTEFLLQPIVTSNEAVILWNPDNRGDQYFLIENRKRIGFDGEILGEGLLVYHVDESMNDNDDPWWPDNQGNRHDLVALEQADNRWDMETFENDADDGDPFPGSEDNRNLNGDSEPGSRNYAGEETGVAILDITPSEYGIWARWLVGVDPPAIEQTLTLADGWNRVSSRVTPISDNILELFESLVEDNILFILKDDMGRFFMPRYNYNDLPRWDSNSGYSLRMLREAEFIIDGSEISAQRPVRLYAGWQMIPYFPDYRLPVRIAFESVTDHLMVVKDNQGRFYLPQYDYSDMPDLQAGQGYSVKMSEEDVLTYPFDD